MTTTSPKRVALYARVSTDGQTVDNQLHELRRVARRHEWEVVAEFVDKGISGAKGKEERPALKRLLQAVARRDFDLVGAWSVDRLGRSLSGLLELLGELQAKRVGLYLDQQGLDTTTPAGRAMFQMVGVFAEFERAMIVERVRAGLRRAVKEGKQLGRPALPDDKREEVLRHLRGGVSIRKAAALADVGISTVQRIKQEGGARVGAD